MYRRIIAFLLISVLAVTGLYAMTNQQKGKPVFGNAALNVDAKDIPQLTSDALNGSSKAASRLANFYGFVKLDYGKERYWQQIAAENGDPQAMYNFASVLSQTGNPNDKVRSHFWMEKAASKGYKAAGIPEKQSLAPD